MPPVYEIRIYRLKKILEFKTVIGENIRRFTTKDHPSDASLFKKSLFPKGRVQPITLDDLNRDTIVIIALRKNHYLINTTLSTEDLTKEVWCDTEKSNLNYIFYNFTLHSFTIRPRIAEDKIGLLEYFSEHLEDNLIRETILSFLNLPKSPNDLLKKLLLERADNSIKYEGDTFAIKYRGKQTIRLKNHTSVRDIVYIIKNKVNTKNIAELFNISRKKKVEIENDDALDDIIRSTNRLLEKIRDIESKLNIPKVERFSTFVKNYINLDAVATSISYEAPDEIHWEIDVPEKLTD